MRITYDEEADAAYVYLAGLVDKPETRQVNSDVYLDFDENGRLLGVEVLAASKNLDLEYLASVIEILDDAALRWHQLRRELIMRQRNGLPLYTGNQRKKNWIEAVGDDYLVARRETSGSLVTITRDDLEIWDKASHKKKRRTDLIEALWEIGNYPSLL